jgi:SAM-dependent methyltransferase
MNVPPEVFNEDYLYFYGELIGDERSDADAELVARLLALSAEARVLDVPCGAGRIAGRLARRGCSVVGLDINERFLALARERYPKVVFEHCDMRGLRYQAEFDAVVNWFTSFGYFDSATNDAVLAAFARALKPGGQLLLELHNPGHLARLLELAGGSVASLAEREGDLMVDRTTYGAAGGYSRTERFIVRDGELRKCEFSLEQIPADQLLRRLEEAGFGEVRLYGRGGGPFEADGPRLIAVAER